MPYKSKKKLRAYKAKWRRENYDSRERAKAKAYNRNKNLTIKYGLSSEDYIRMMVQQEGKCLICGNAWWELLTVDHDHATGAIRGLLCGACNLGIGCLKDSPKLAESALSYLRKNNASDKS